MNDTELWSQFLQRLKNQTRSEVWAYIDLLTCSVSDNHWELHAPDLAIVQWIETNLSEKIGGILQDMGLQVTFQITTQNAPVAAGTTPDAGVLPFARAVRTHKETPFERSEAGFRMTPANGRVRPVTAEQAMQSNLNADFTFDTFVKGKSNEMAYAASQNVAANPGSKYPLLYLYGGVGLGKTHLMHAIGNALQRKGMRVLYLTCEAFMNELISSIQFKNSEVFRTRMRQHCDVLLLDDIQFIAGKRSTEEEFFHTFNELMNAHKQVVLTSDKLPGDIEGLEARLSSRFSNGLQVDIQFPDYETRMAILKTKAQRENIALPNEVADYIASQETSNIRELEGYLRRIAAVSETYGVPITRSLAVDALEPFVKRQHVQIGIESIINKVCTYYGISREDIMSRTRKKNIARPRQVIMYLAYEHSGLSYPEIGKVFKYDHTSILHGCEVIRKERTNNSAFEFEIKKLETDLLRR